ncbi:MAG: hypothetical protein HY203_06835 [Nitrospirae bacterium]|nr:hypothetical protein [Nitrospirota bacterium]
MAIALPIYFSWHPYSPKSFVPLMLGIIGSVMMVLGALLYALRKRIRVLRSLGKMNTWLEVHITLCLLGPLLVVYHTGFFIKSLNAAIAFYAMLTVVASGVFGRSQRFSESQTILGTIQTFFNLREKQKSRGFLGSFFLLIRLDRLEKKVRGRLGRLPGPQSVMHVVNPMKNPDSLETLIVKRIRLEKNVSALEATTSLFAYWHKLHVPFIWILAFTMIIHVAAVLIF